MPQFEQFDPNNDGNKSGEEMKRLYENDFSAKQFSTTPYKEISNIPENAGMYGENEDVSVEARNDEKITPEDSNILKFGKLSNDYLNGLGEKPNNLTIDQVREYALAYRESLSPQEQAEEDALVAKLIRNDIKEKSNLKYTEATDLKQNLIAQASPSTLQPTKLNRRSLWDYISGRKERA